MFPSKIFQKLVMLCYTGTNYSVGGSTKPLAGPPFLISFLVILWFWAPAICGGENKDKFLLGLLDQASTTLLNREWENIGEKKVLINLLLSVIFASHASLKSSPAPIKMQLPRPRLPPCSRHGPETGILYWDSRGPEGYIFWEHSTTCSVFGSLIFRNHIKPTHFHLR